MLFNSWTFAIFLPLVFVLYHGVRRVTWQVGILTIASFVFYGWHTPWLVLLLIFSTAANATAAQALMSSAVSGPRRRLVLLAALAFNLGALAFFKYGGLFSRTLLPAPWRSHFLWLENVPLPIGISFYTFQGISLVVECWRVGPAGFPGLAPPHGARAVAWFHTRVWFFKAFFPQLIAGPIVKAAQFFHQIGVKRLAEIDWDGAVRKLVLGFFLKMVVADNLKEATSVLHYPEFLELPPLNLLALLYGFSFQILADFAGYSLIAQGLARLFGYELPLNFNHPYLSGSVTEFWRRWHLSLSSWLREYLYLPLGGNRRGEVRTYVNLFVVMFLGGLWHGAAWSYAVWGTAHGLLLAFERFTGVGRGKVEDWPWWRRAIGIVITFNLVSLLWLLFKLPDIRHAAEYLRCLVVNRGPVMPQPVFIIALFGLPVVLHHLWAVVRPAAPSLPTTWRRCETLVYALMFAAIIVNSGTPGEFIYFQF